MARKARRLPPPVVPMYPQKVVLSDGSSFTHWTTSPKSSIRLTRDISNSPLWTLSAASGGEEDDTSGRLSKFRLRFDQSGALDNYEASQHLNSPQEENDDLHAQFSQPSIPVLSEEDLKEIYRDLLRIEYIDKPRDVFLKSILNGYKEIA
ncbi:17358_t:CDS:2, partial [Acaulospora colombiana]